MIARARLFAASCLALLAACSGSVDPSPNVVDPTRITILPAIATMYSGLPTTFVLSGGTGSYIVTSSNQAIIPIAGSIIRREVTLIPNPVLADTEVTLTVRDTGTTPIASATVTVRPGTINNSVTITPSVDTCDPGVCSGSDAEVSVTLSAGGIPLAARGVRFEVLTGEFRFITTPAGVPEVLGLNVRVATDERGIARARFRTTPLAATHTATLQVVDEASGAFQRTSFTIVQFTGNADPFFTVPQTMVFTGPSTTECASNARGEFSIHGGTPPYTISGQGTGFSLVPSVVQASGGVFSVTANGACAPSPGVAIAITDATGRTITAFVVNQVGTVDPATLVAAPSSVTLNSCTARASVTVAGGRGSYQVTQFAGPVTATQSSAGVVTIQRTNPSAAVTAGAGPEARVGISDGQSVVEVEVELVGAGAGACPQAAFTATPNTVTLASCASVATVTLAGGSGTYSAASGDTRVTATVTGGNTLNISRANPSTGPVGTVTVTASDGASAIPVTVNAGAFNCP